MDKKSVRFKKIHEDAITPKYKSEEAAAFDLHSIENKEIEPGETVMVQTGISVELPKGYGLQLWDRSSLGVKGIPRFAGLIDSDYRGELKVVLHNTTKDSFKVSKGDRIIQGSIVPIMQADFQEVENLEDTSRGEGGFGSTGK